MVDTLAAVADGDGLIPADIAVALLRSVKRGSVVTAYYSNQSTIASDHDWL